MMIVGLGMVLAMRAGSSFYQRKLIADIGEAVAAAFHFQKLIHSETGIEPAVSVIDPEVIVENHEAANFEKFKCLNGIDHHIINIVTAININEI